MEKIFEGDSFDMSLGAIIAQSQVGDSIVVSNDSERVWKVKEKTSHQLVLVNEEIKKANGCEGCGGSNFIEFPAFGKNSYQCQDCGIVITLGEKIVSTMVINTFANLSLEERLENKFVRASEVMEETTV